MAPCAPSLNIDLVTLWVVFLFLGHGGSNIKCGGEGGKYLIQSEMLVQDFAIPLSAGFKKDKNKTNSTPLRNRMCIYIYGRSQGVA